MANWTWVSSAVFFMIVFAIGMMAVDCHWFRCRASLEPNQMHKIYINVFSMHSVFLLWIKFGFINNNKLASEPNKPTKTLLLLALIWLWLGSCEVCYLNWAFAVFSDGVLCCCVIKFQDIVGTPSLLIPILLWAWNPWKGYIILFYNVII